jgi:hypothetical protein
MSSKDPAPPPSTAAAAAASSSVYKAFVNESRRRSTTNSTSTSSQASEPTNSKGSNNVNDTGNSLDNQQKNGVNWFGMACLVIVLPTIVGVLGLSTAYWESQYQQDWRQIDFYQDFALPFGLTLLAVCIVGFQTNGFTSRQPKSLIPWPEFPAVQPDLYKKRAARMAKSKPKRE